MIILASDHAGYLLKEEIKKFFNKENIIAIDVGCYSREQVDDYPDFAKAGNVKVLEDSRNVGIYICGSGIGMSMAANRNDANVLCLGARSTKMKKAIKIVKVFLTTDFEGGRHVRRIKKMS